MSDDNPDFPGPLAGIRAGLAARAMTHLLILPCDVPYIDARLLADLREIAQRHPTAAGDGAPWRVLGTLDLHHPHLLRNAVEQAWHAGERSPRKIFLQLGGMGLECPADDPRLANLNTPELLHPKSDVSE